MQRLKSISQLSRKKRKKHDKIVLLGKAKFNAFPVLISNALTEWYISHGEFVSINTVLREYNKMKEKIKSSETSVDYNT